MTIENKKTEIRDKRDNGSGTVIKLPNGKVKIKKQYGKKPDGKPKFHSFTADTEAKARKKMKEFDLEFYGKPKDQMDKEYFYYTLSSWLENIHRNNIADTTYGSYYEVIENHIKDSNLATIQTANINYDVLQNFINTMIHTPYKKDESGKEYYYSKGTIDRTLSVLKAFFSWAEATNKIVPNPIRAVKPVNKKNVKTAKKQVKYYDTEDAKKITDECFKLNDNGEYKYSRNGLAIVLLLQTGLRIAEALALRYEDIDHENNLLIIDEQMVRMKNVETGKYEYKLHKYLKNGSEIRKIPMTNVLQEVLSEFKRLSKKTKPRDFILMNPNNKMLEQRNIRRTLNTIEKNTNTKIQNAGLHILRHSFCSLALQTKDENGNYIDIKLVSEWLGHSRTSTSMDIYQHVLEERRSKATAAIKELF